MTDIRNTIAWVILVCSLVLLWDAYQIHNGKPATFFPRGDTAVQPNAATDNTLPQIEGLPADIPSVANTTGQDIPLTAPIVRGELVVVKTDQTQVVFTTSGATIVELDLLKFADQEDQDKPVKLINPVYDYEVRTGVIDSERKVALPDHNSNMHLIPGPLEMQEGQDSLTVSFESDEVNGIKVVKNYTFTRDSYVITVSTDVINVGTTPITPQLYYQLMRNDYALPGTGSMFGGGNTFTGFAYYTDDIRYKKLAFKDITQGVITKANDGWIGMVQHYFVSAWYFKDDVQRHFYTQTLSNQKDHVIGLITPLQTLAPGEKISQEAQLYSGPQTEKTLEKLTPGLDLVKDYGMFKIFAKPLFWLLYLLNEFINNWGWSIVALVILIKAAFFWLNARAYRSMAKMKALAPRLQELNERYKDDPQQKQQETMRIYREEKINPLGGCLPIVVQIPVFIALYWVLLSSIEMRNAPWIGWITDLSVKDPYFILPGIMTASTLLQTWLNPTPADPTQAKIMWIMPLAFSVMFFMFPAGLVLYWVTNNILSIAQQWFINKRLGIVNK